MHTLYVSGNDVSNFASEWTKFTFVPPLLAVTLQMGGKRSLTIGTVFTRVDGADKRFRITVHFLVSFNCISAVRFKITIWLITLEGFFEGVSFDVSIEKTFTFSGIFTD